MPPLTALRATKESYPDLEVVIYPWHRELSKLRFSDVKAKGDVLDGINFI
jgi:hypothetical protein